jgi:hypothetical protein
MWSTYCFEDGCLGSFEDRSGGVAGQIVSNRSYNNNHRTTSIAIVRW